MPAITGRRPPSALHRDLQQLRRFRRGERRRFAGRAADDDAVAAFARVPVEQAPECDVIDVAGLRHRRHERNEAAAEHVTPRPIGRHRRRDGTGARHAERKARARRAISSPCRSRYTPRKPPLFPHETIHRNLRHRQRPHRPRARSLEGRRGLRRQHQRKPHDGARQRIRDADAGRRQLALARQARKRAREARRGLGRHDPGAAHRRSAPSREDMVPYSVDVVCLDQAGIVAGLSGFFAAAASTSASSPRAPTPRRTPARRCSRCRWSSTCRRASTSRALREEFMDFCDEHEPRRDPRAGEDLTRWPRASGRQGADILAARHGRRVPAGRRRRGENLVVYFYPKDNTPGCTLEGSEFRDLHAAFRRARTAVLGVSTDSSSRHDKFKRQDEVPVRAAARRGRRRSAGCST